MISNVISDVVIASVYFEKTRLKKFIINKSQETTVLGVHRKWTCAMKLRLEK